MRRHAISDLQRKALRAWFFHQLPRPRHKDCIDWFYRHYNHRISQSTVSEILSNRFSHLDQEPSSHASSIRESFRQRLPNWPILEAILFDWQQLIEQKGGITTGDILIEKAREIWHQIPQYSDQPIPEFSAGWLLGFKQRHNLRKRTLHGEAASAETAEEEMKAIRTLCGEYSEEDIYNMDETGLFWRRGPSSGLASQNRPGVKKDKSRISVVACTNCTGSDRLPIWFIGYAQRPYSLRRLNIRALGGYWKSNKKAWMNSLIMREWLLAFYSHIGSRTVILFMDNFPAHIRGVELTPPPSNIRIQWLPANSTSLYQPLDQGIIQNLKTHFRKYWLRYIVQGFENNKDPFKEVSLYNAVHWVLRAWNYDVSNTTIYNCFRKSCIIQPQISSLPTEPRPDLSRLYTRAREAGQIQEVMSLSNFLNPPDENIEETVEDSLQSIVSHHVGGNMDADTAIEEAQPDIEEGSAPIIVPSIQQALEGLRAVLRYKEHCEDTEIEEIRALEKLERQLASKELYSRSQATLDSWLIQELYD